jgi:hypothetical protein
MASYDDRERDYYQVLALSEKRTLELVDRIVSALVQHRSRVTMLTIVHWLPNEWQCIEDPEVMDYFHSELEAQRASAAADVDDAKGAAAAAAGETHRIDRLDFSAALGGNEDDYHCAMAMLDFLDVRFYCSYITRTSGVVYLKPQRKPRAKRGFFDALGDLIQGRGTPWRVVEYRVVLDLVLTMFSRRENALQLASAMRYGAARQDAEPGLALSDTSRQPQPLKPRSALTGSAARSRSDSANVRSAASAHSNEATKSLSASVVERSRSPIISAVAGSPERAVSANSRSSPNRVSPLGSASASASVTEFAPPASASSSASSSSSIELVERRDSPPATPRAVLTCAPVALRSSGSGPRRRIMTQAPAPSQRRSLSDTSGSSSRSKLPGV